MTIYLRAGTPADAEACGAICHAAFDAVCARHGFPPDFPSAEAASGLMSMLLGHPRFYSVVAEQTAASSAATSSTSGRTIHGVGPITVDPAGQNRGVGARLMQDVIDRVGPAEAAGVRLLQAGFHNRSLCLYSMLGFRTREPVSILQGAPLRRSSSAMTFAPRRRPIRGLQRGLPAGAWLRSRRRTRRCDRREQASVVEHQGRITGYTTGIAFISHTVAETNFGLMALIGAAPRSAGPGFLLPTRNHEVFTWCLKGGLKLVYQMTLMTMGLYNEPTGAYMPSVLY